MKTSSITHEVEKTDNIKYYYAVRNLTEANNFFLNLNLEVLNGCAFNCTGCYVKRTIKDPFTDAAADNLINLIAEFKSKGGMVPHIAFMNPTDFLVAKNTAEILANPKMREVLSNFRRISFVTVLQGGLEDEISEVWNKYYSDKELEINVAFEPGQILDPFYVDAIRQTKNRIFPKFKSKGAVRSFAVFNVFGYDEYRDIAEMNYEGMHETIKDIFETTIDFNFSIFRRLNTPREDLMRDMEIVRNLFDDGVTDGTKTFLRFSFGNLNDSLIERQYNFRKGEFFLSPLLYERAADFSEEFKVERQGEQYCFEDFVNAEKQIITQQYLYSEKTSECSQCAYLGTCVDRMILALYQKYKLTECYVAKKALDAVNKINNTNEFIQ